MELRSILVATDFAPGSLPALAEALRINPEINQVSITHRTALAHSTRNGDCAAHHVEELTDPVEETTIAHGSVLLVCTFHIGSAKPCR